MNDKTYCVIMAGGIGSRFWPLSRSSRPKQFLDILGTGKTFLRATYERFSPAIPAENFLVVTNANYKDIVLEQIPELTENQVLCEPIGRNTAPCIAYAAFRLNAVDPDSTMIVTPSDHYIADEEGFRDTLSECVGFIGDGDAMMTIGIRPDNPNTGYGYIQVEDGGGKPEGICKVKTFTEKPDLEMAKVFLGSGEFFWNSGIFIWNTKTIRTAVRDLLPEMYGLFNSISQDYNTPSETDSIRKIYPECKSVSVDIGIMEKAKNVWVNCTDFGWSDIGTWSALYEHSQKDENGNVSSGDNVLVNTKNCIIKASDGKLVMIDGLEDYIVVDRDNVLMICPRSSEQTIKAYIDEVKFKYGDEFI